MNEPSREADWITSEETELLRDRREGFVLSREFFGRAKLQTALVLGFAILLLVTLATVAMAGGAAFLAVAALSLGSIPLARHWERRQEARREPDREVRESFGRGGRFVSILVLQGSAPTGEDRGMMWFEEGKLYFSGHRTSFGLVPYQASSFGLVDQSVPGMPNAVRLFLHRESDAGPMSLAFQAVLPPSVNPVFARSEIKAEIDHWMSGESDEVGQWPPATLGPGIVSEARLLATLAGFFAPVLILPGLIYWALASATSAGLVAFICLSLYVGVLAPPFFRALRDRRRLRRATLDVRQNRPR